MRNSFIMRKYFWLPLLSIFFFSTAFCAAEPALRIADKPWTVLRSLMVSYPDKITGVDYDFVLKDWFVLVGDQRLYWASGRILPVGELGNADKWRAYVDYLYPEEIPDPSTFSAETIGRLNADLLAEKRSKAPIYHIGFFDLLYDGKTRRSIESHIRRIDYLGKRVSVHTTIIPQLQRVESRLYKLAEKDEEVKTFLSSILSIEGYNWREIADSSSRSFHSWGLAIDFLPKNWGKKNIYWNWLSYWNDSWMLIPLERRWMPPPSVVKAYEDEGFIWGGKWLLWDNMHFEYRPELIQLRKWGFDGDLDE